MTFDRFKPPTSSDNMASCVCCGERVHYENVNSVGECPLCAEYFEDDDMTANEIQSHTVSARVSAMQSEKMFLQALHAELGRQWRHVGDRIAAIDNQIKAERASVGDRDNE